MSGNMFDNKDYPTKWALDPSSYRNMDNDQVDWAALAQEWIKMKETNIPSAPAPPMISGNPTSSSLGGGGEAPMDMDVKDDEIPPAPPAPNISGANNWNRWNQWESNWNQASIGAGSANWDWKYVSPEASKTLTRVPNNLLIPPPAPVISSTPAFADRAAVGSCVPLESTSSLSPSFGYNTMSLPRSHFSSQVPSSGFWNNEQHPHAPAGQTPSFPFVKDARPNIARITPSSAATPASHPLPTLDMSTSRNRDVKEPTPENDSLSSLDTIKRKQLPAWIREGLEKMEREKQKAMERERQAVLRKQELEACKKIKDQARAVLSPDKSKFDSDSEKELPENELKDAESKDDLVTKPPKTNCDLGSPDVTRPRKTRFRDASSPEKLSNLVQLPNADINTNNSTASSGSCVRMNKEELMQNLMLKVRRSLTEILLEVTNDEIISTCEEVWKNFHNRGKIIPTSSVTTAPLAQITRRLGLGIYSDSDSESSDEHTVQNQSEKPMSSRSDSDEELKETLRLRQQTFKKTEAEIEASLAEEEENTKGEDQVAKHKKAEIVIDRKDRMSSSYDKSTKDKNKPKAGHAVQESNRNWKENYGRANDNSSAGNRNLSPDTIASKSIARSTPDAEISSSSESGNVSCSSRRKTAYSSKNGKNNASSSPGGKRNARPSDYAKRYSSSRSRSRSKNGSSSRDNSCESSAATEKTVQNRDESASENYKTSREFSKKCASLKRTQYCKARSRSTSQSDAHLRSESRSRSRSRSKSRSPTRSSSTARSRQKRSRSRSYSSFRRQTRNRNNAHSRSRHRSPRSQSQSRSRSRSKSRSRKRSKSSYSSKSSATGTTKSEGAKRRSSRSRSTDRSRRSSSNTRQSKSSHRQPRHHRAYERDRTASKSRRHYMD